LELNEKLGVSREGRFSIVYSTYLWNPGLSCGCVVFTNRFQGASDINKSCMRLHCKVWVTEQVQENQISMEEEIWEQGSRIYEPTHALFPSFW